MQGRLVKARLHPHDGGSPLEFMFNPKELSFEKIVETADNPGARSEASGKAMVSFANIKPNKISVSDVLFDTFETGDNVVTKYITNFTKAAEFTKEGSGGEKRPPLFLFSWGPQTYFEYCFVEKVDYKLTKFLSDGTPVRALISSLVLKETEGDFTDQPSNPRAVVDPRTDNLGDRLSGLGA